MIRLTDVVTLAAAAGANWFVRPATYVGGMVGYAEAVEAPIFGMKLGVTERRQSGVRFETRVLAVSHDVSRPLGYVVVGYTIR